MGGCLCQEVGGQKGNADLGRCWFFGSDPDWKSHRGAGVHRKAHYSPCNAQRLPATWTAPSFWSIEPVAAALWWDLLTDDFGNRTVLSIGWFEFASMCTRRIWSGFHNCNKMTTETLRATFRVRCLLQCCGAFLEPFFKCGAVTWTILAMHCSSISQQQVSHNHSTSTSLSLHLCPLALHKPLLPMTLQVRRSRDWLCKTTSQRLVTAAPTILNNVAAVFIYTGRWRILSAKCCVHCNLSNPIDKLLDINGVCFSCHLLQNSPRFPWNSNELRGLVPLKTFKNCPKTVLAQAHIPSSPEELCLDEAAASPWIEYAMPVSSTDKHWDHMRPKLLRKPPQQSLNESSRKLAWQISLFFLEYVKMPLGIV